MLEDDGFPFGSVFVDAVANTQTLLGLRHDSSVSHVSEFLVTVEILALVLANFVANFKIHRIEAHARLAIHNLG